MAYVLPENFLLFIAFLCGIILKFFVGKVQIDECVYMTTSNVFISDNVLLLGWMMTFLLVAVFFFRDKNQPFKLLDLLIYRKLIF